METGAGESPKGGPCQGLPPGKTWFPEGNKNKRFPRAGKAPIEDMGATERRMARAARILGGPWPAKIVPQAPKTETQL